MEVALRYELIKNIPELADSIYPTNAPEGAEKPYLVYTRISTKKDKTLQGYGNGGALSYMFSIMATKYSDMKSLTKKVEDFLISLPHAGIGASKIHIEDLDINNIDEQYEHALGVNRGIIDFTIYY
jgi:hypothetical protein